MSSKAYSLKERKKMSQVEIGLCGPSGVKPRKESTPDILLASIGAAVFMIAFAVFKRALRTQEALALPAGLAWAAGLALAAWATLRIWRRDDDAALMQVGTYGFVFLVSAHDNMPKGSAWAMIAALLPLAPAAVFAWSTFRLARHADELQRRIAQEALAFGFVVALFAALIGAALETAGLPRLSWAWMAGVLIVGCGVGMLLSNRRYR
jgi:hypothetical protein